MVMKTEYKQIVLCKANPLLLYTNSLAINWLGATKQTVIPIINHENLRISG
jgi:hypothetical protein